MKILRIANIMSNRNNGMGRVMHFSADELRLLGHTVDFMFSEDVPRRHPGKGDRFFFPVALVRAVRERLRHGETYDVVEIHEPSAAWYCHLRRHDKTLPPCVIMSHGLEEAQWQLRLKLLKMLGQKVSLKSRFSVPITLLTQARYGLRYCQQIMCLNSYDEQYLQKTLGIKPSKISRIQNGVDPKFFVVRSEAEDSNTLLFVGSWLEKKGIRVLSEVFQQLQSQHACLKLLLLGTGVAKEDVLKSFPENLRDVIQVRERVDDKELLDAYANSSIFLFPTYFEPWGLVLTEAAAAGMAVVTTDVGGPADFFTQGQDALLTPIMDAAALVEAVNKLIADPALRLRLGQQAQERARQFTWKTAAESQLRAYERAVQVAASE